MPTACDTAWISTITTRSALHAITALTSWRIGRRAKTATRIRPRIRAGHRQEGSAEPITANMKRHALLIQKPEPASANEIVSTGSQGQCLKVKKQEN